MDTGSLSIGIILVIICIIPFAVMQFKSKQKKLALIDHLREKAQEVSAIITTYETCGSFVIGIDEENNFLFFHQENDNTVNDKHLNLNEVKSCKVITSMGSNGNKQHIERLALGFEPKSKNSNLPSFELFNAKGSLELGTELIMAKDWASRINQRLTS